MSILSYCARKWPLLLMIEAPLERMMSMPHHNSLRTCWERSYRYIVRYYTISFPFKFSFEFENFCILCIIISKTCTFTKNRSFSSKNNPDKMTRAKITIVQEAGDELVLSQDDHMGNIIFWLPICVSAGSFGNSVLSLSL